MRTLDALFVTVVSFVVVVFGLGFTVGSNVPVWLVVVLWLVVGGIICCLMDKNR